MYTSVKPLPQSTHEIFPYLKCFLMSLPHFLEEMLEEDSGHLAHFLVSRQLACQSLTACFILHCWTNTVSAVLGSCRAQLSPAFN